jgi:hypothetical protein
MQIYEGVIAPILADIQKMPRKLDDRWVSVIRLSGVQHPPALVPVDDARRNRTRIGACADEKQDHEQQ